MFEVYARYLVSNGDTPVEHKKPLNGISENDLKITEILIFDDTSQDESLVLIDPKLSLEDSTAGKFEFTLPTSNIAYGYIGRMDTEIRVFQNGDEIWRGRILEEEMDFENRKKYTCEGCLAYLNDTVLPPKEWLNASITDLIDAIISNHNSQCTIGNWPLNKTFVRGTVELEDNRTNEDYIKELKSNPYVSNFEKSLEALNTIVEKFKGHILVTFEDETMKISIRDKLRNGISTANQTINFGQNLLDFTRNYDMSKIATAVLPLGKLPSDFKAKDKLLADSTNGTFTAWNYDDYRHTVESFPDTIITKWRDGICNPLLSVQYFYTITGIHVTPGKKYSLTSTLPSGMIAAAFYTANGVYVSSVKHDGGTNQAPGQWVRKIISIPSDCNLVSICSYGGYPALEVATGNGRDWNGNVIQFPTNPGELQGDQSQEIKVADDQTQTVFDEYGYNSIIQYCGYEPEESSSGSSAPSFSQIADWDSESQSYRFKDAYSDATNQYTDPAQTDPYFVAYGITKNRKRQVLYKVKPILEGGATNPGQFIAENGGLRPDGVHGSTFDTIKVTFNRPLKLDGTEVKDDIKFFLNTRMDYNFFVYVILDAYGNIISSKNGKETTDYNAHTMFVDEVITVPYEGKTVLICGERGLTQIHSYNELYDKTDMYLTVEEVNNGSYFVVDHNALTSHGWIVKNIEFEVEDKETLLSRALEYLHDVQFDDMKLEVTAVDLSYINPDIRPFKMYELVHCVSVPHSLDKLFPVIGIDMPLDAPDQVKYTMGDNIDKHEYTEATNDIVADLMEQLQKIPSRESVLVAAKENATQIMKQYCHGYVTIVEDDPRFGSCIYISDNEDYTASRHHWLWNLNGLGYSKDGGATYGLAITMDGSIVADYITAGTLSADRVRTGLLVDIEGKNYWNLETGEIALGLNLKTTYIENAQDYYGENGASWPTSNNNIELGSWIYDRTNHEYNFKSVFGSGINMVDGIYSYCGTMDETNAQGQSTGRQVQERWYNPKTSRYETRDKKYYWLYISASVISTGLLKSRNGRLFFDLDTGALWCAGVDKVALDSNGNVIYYNGNNQGGGSWDAEPSTIAKHIQFIEGALYGFSGSTFSGSYVTYNVDEEYSLKNNNSGETAINYSTGTLPNGNPVSTYDIFRTGHINPGTLEGYLDLVTSYQNINESGTVEESGYDLLLAGSNRVHINFGNKILIGKAANLFDNSPEVIIYGESGKVHIGDPNVFANWMNNPITPRSGGSRVGTGVVDLEVYGNTQIGHKYSSSDTAPPKNVADNYKADLTVYGSATFGRNYYTEEVEESEVEVYAGTSTQWSNGHLIATTGTPMQIENPSQKTVKKYYDDVVFHANVKIDSANGIEDLEILKVKKYMIIGTDYKKNNIRDTSWKFNDGRYLSTSLSTKLNQTDSESYAQENQIYGNMLVNGRVQFSGGIIAGVGSRMILGHVEQGSSATELIPYGSSGDQFKMSQRYELIASGKKYDLLKQRFAVEGNSLFFGDVNQLEGNSGLNGLEVRTHITGVPTQGADTGRSQHESDTPGTTTVNDINAYVFEPEYIFSARRHGNGNIAKVYIRSTQLFISDMARDDAYAATSSNGIYIEHTAANNTSYPINIRLDTPIIYEGLSQYGLLINPSAPSHSLTGTTRTPAEGTAAPHIVTVRGGLVVRGFRNDSTNTSYLEFGYSKLHYDGTIEVINTSSGSELSKAKIDTSGKFTGCFIDITNYPPAQLKSRTGSLLTFSGSTNVGSVAARNIYIFKYYATEDYRPSIILSNSGEVSANSFYLRSVETFDISGTPTVKEVSRGYLTSSGVSAKTVQINTVGTTGATNNVTVIDNDRNGNFNKVNIATKYTNSSGNEATTGTMVLQGKYKKQYNSNYNYTYLSCNTGLTVPRIDLVNAPDDDGWLPSSDGMLTAYNIRTIDKVNNTVDSNIKYYLNASEITSGGSSYFYDIYIRTYKKNTDSGGNYTGTYSVTNTRVLYYDSSASEYKLQNINRAYIQYLHLSGNTITANELTVKNTSNTELFTVDSVGVATCKGKMIVKYYSSTDSYKNAIDVRNSSNSTIAYITNAGKIGGTSLDIGTGSITCGTITSSSKIKLDNSTSGSYVVDIYNSGSQKAYIRADGYMWTSNSIYAKSFNINGSGSISYGITSGGTVNCSGVSAGSGTISGGTISGTTISGTTISGTTISGDTISGITISGGSISGSSLSLGSGTITCGAINATNNTMGNDANISRFKAIDAYSTDYAYGFHVTTGGSVIINGYIAAVNSDGHFVSNGSYSDKRLKTKIKKVDYSALEIVNDIPIVKYEWKHDNKQVAAGFIAQDIENIKNQEVASKLVHGFKDDSIEKSIDPNQLTAILWKAVQELSAEVKDLKAELKQLKCA